MDAVSTGDVLCGRYALRGVLGRGGMAEVRDGWDNRLGRPVAVKLLHQGLAADAESRRRFEAEARAAAALSHPNIVAVHDTGEHRGAPFIVMERLPGNTLADLIARGPLAQPVMRGVLAEVLAALAAAHRVGILHRDIKPGNILFTSTGMAKLADFGIAKTAETNHTVAGQIVGTVAYLSPDRLAGRPATPADDVYAVGAVGYEALTGRRAFPQDTLGSLSHAIMTQRPPALAALRPDIDPDLGALIECALAPNAQWRFDSADAMNAALAAGSRRPFGVRPSTMVLTSPVPPLPQPDGGGTHGRRPAMSRSKRVTMLALALVAIVITAAAFIADSWTHPVPAPVTPPTNTTASSTATPASAVPAPPSTAPLAPPAEPPKKHGHGKGHNKG